MSATVSQFFQLDHVFVEHKDFQVQEIIASIPEQWKVLEIRYKSVIKYDLWLNGPPCWQDIYSLCIFANVI